MGVGSKRNRSLNDLPSRYEAGPTRTRPVVPALVIALLFLALGGSLIWMARDTLETAAPPDPGPDPVQVAAEIGSIIDTAERLMLAREPGKAEAVMRQAVQQYPVDQDLRRMYARVLLDQERFADAYEQLLNALAIGPRDAELEFTAGLVANTAGKRDRALEHFAAAQTADPANPEYPLNLGMIRAQLSQYAEAEADLVRAVNMDPTLDKAWGTLAEISLRRNQIDMALQHIAKARQIRPDDVRWRLVEARALKRKGMVEEALTLLTALDDETRSRDDVMQTMAECYGLVRKPISAARMYAAASDAQPTRADLALEAAVWFDRAGETARALQYASRVQVLGDSSADKLITRLTAAVESDSGG